MCRLGVRDLPKLLNSAMACTAIASPRPSSPTPSLVFPLMLTRSIDRRRARAARFARIASMYGASFGRSSDHRDVDVADLEAPARRTIATARPSRSRLDAPFHCGSVSGKCRPMSPSARGAENRVGHGVAHRVGVGVPERARARTESSRRRGSAAGPRRAGAGRSRCPRGRFAPACRAPCRSPPPSAHRPAS